MTKYLRLILAGIVLALLTSAASVVLPQQVADQTPVTQIEEASASPWSHQANIVFDKNSTGLKYLLVCDYYSDVPVNHCAGVWRSLRQGQSTKGTLGWGDADAFMRPKGCKAKLRGSGANGGVNYGSGAAKTVKVPGFFGIKRRIDVDC
jgi:hypothetical protein